MAPSLTSRRNLMISGFMACASAWLPARSFPGSDTPGCLAPLLRDLGSLSSWMRPEYDGNGTAVIHCGVKDLSAWAKRAGALAGKEGKVLARGNTLSFRLPEMQVRIVIHPDFA